MEREKFEELVDEAIENLPPEFLDNIHNVAIIVEDWPSPEQLDEVQVRRRQDLLGLYEGVPLTKRGQRFIGGMPDRVSIFQKPVELRCRSDKEIKETLRQVLYHEIGHYFGLSEEQLERLEGRR